MSQPGETASKVIQFAVFALDRGLPLKEVVISEDIFSKLLVDLALDEGRTAKRNFVDLQVRDVWFQVVLSNALSPNTMQAK